MSHLVLAETLWVLDSVYDLSRVQIATAVEMLLNHRELSLQYADVVTAALGHYRRRPPVEFSDCLVLEIARKAGHLPIATINRNFAKLDDVQRRDDSGAVSGGLVLIPLVCRERLHWGRQMTTPIRRQLPTRGVPTTSRESHRA